MKRIVCLILMLSLLLPCVPVNAAAEASQSLQAESNQNTLDGIFYGVIRVLTEDASEPEPYRAAKDEIGNVYLHMGDFVNIIGGTIRKRPSLHVYDIQFGNWELTIYCEEMGARLFYKPAGCSTSYNYLDEPAYFTRALLNHDTGHWYFPMDELLYLSMCTWICEENYVTVTQPPTLLDLLPRIKEVAKYNPTYTDLMGETEGEQAVNAINYGFYSAVDEIDATFILDSFLVFFGAKDSFTFEEEILKECLLSMSDDSPYEGENSGIYAAGMESFSYFNDQFSNAAQLLDICKPEMQVAITEKLSNLRGCPLKATEIDEITKNSKFWSTDVAIAGTVADYVFAVADAFWTQQYLQENFKERLLLIQEWTKDEKENHFGKQLHAAAKSAYNEYYGSYCQALGENLKLGYAIDIVNAVVDIKAISTPMLALTLFDLYIEILKASPAMKDDFAEAEAAHNALELINTSAYMGNATTQALKKLHDPSSISGDYLNDLRLGCQISQNAAMHAQKKLLDMGKALNKSTEPGAAFLLAVNDSAKFDKVLLITGDFYELYCNESGCVREQIPPEYVYGGDGIFLAPVNQLTTAPSGFTPIETKKDLLAVANNMAGNYILMEDLEIDGWTPMGSWDNPFTGIFDGNGHSITINLEKSVTLTEEVYGGIFNFVTNGTVKNLHVKGDWNYIRREATDDAYFVYDICIGGIASYADGNATIYNCVSSVNISSDVEPWRYMYLSNYIAGIVGCAGYLDAGKIRISYCRNLGELKNTANSAGIACNAGYAEIYACQNDGTIDSDYTAAGIATYHSGSIISCANRGEIYSLSNAYGIASSSGAVRYCVNTGTVYAKGNPVGYVGGIVNSAEDSIKQCISLGTRKIDTFEAGNSDGPICTSMTCKIYDSYWLEDGKYVNSGAVSDTANPELYIGGGKLTEKEMTDEDSFKDYNFISTWTLYEGMRCPYPSVLLLNGQTPPMLETEAE